MATPEREHDQGAIAIEAMAMESYEIGRASGGPTRQHAKG